MSVIVNDLGITPPRRHISGTIMEKSQTYQHGVLKGWRPIPNLEQYSLMVGPFLEREDGEPGRYGVLTSARHGNSNEIVHGGLLLTFADKALAMTAWHTVGHRPRATVQLNHQFMRPVEIGALLEAHCEVVRATRSLIFLTGTFEVEGEVVGAASAVFSHRRP